MVTASFLPLNIFNGSYNFGLLFKENIMSIIVRPGHLPHIKWIDLQGNGTLVECAVMNEDAQGNISYIQVNNLDAVDRRRLLKIITSRNATQFPLWDLLSNITLNNGVNALTYFHQLVRVISQNGVVSTPRQGEVGTGAVVDIAAQKTAQRKNKAARRQEVVTDDDGDSLE